MTTYTYWLIYKDDSNDELLAIMKSKMRDDAIMKSKMRDDTESSPLLSSNDFVNGFAEEEAAKKECGIFCVYVRTTQPEFETYQAFGIKEIKL